MNKLLDYLIEQYCEPHINPLLIPTDDWNRGKEHLLQCIRDRILIA